MIADPSMLTTLAQSLEVEAKRLKLTGKMQAFAFAYITPASAGYLNATQSALAAGYTKNRSGEVGYQNLKKLHIQEFMRLISESAGKMDVVDAICSVFERKVKLSQQVRGDISDYQATGPDGGSGIVFGPESRNTGAVESLKVRTMISEDAEGNCTETSTIQEIKLRDPVRAIAELNKMEGVYPAEKHLNLNMDAKVYESIEAVLDEIDDGSLTVGCESVRRFEVEQKLLAESKTKKQREKK